MCEIREMYPFYILLWFCEIFNCKIGYFTRHLFVKKYENFRIVKLLSPQCYSGAELENIPQCPPRPPPPLPKCITIQQPPRLICKKHIIFLNKVIPEPQVVYRCKRIIIPKVVETTKVVKVPKLTWYSQLVKEPRILYYPSMVPDPYVICSAKVIAEPREVCQSIICQPKPQVIDVPPPSEYCCYPTGRTTIKPSFDCPPCPSPPILPIPGFKSCGSGLSWDPCKTFPCRPCGPSFPCGPYPPCPYLQCSPGCPPCGPFMQCGPCPPYGPYPPYSQCSPCGPCPPYGPFGPYPPCGPCLRPCL